MAHRDDQKLEVQAATDIVRLIGEHVALRPAGREFKGLCPFHDDKNPSMHVVPAKQIFKCFSCGAGGDAFSFVMRYHKMEFREALEHLAERAGIVLRREAARGRGPGAGETADDAGPSERKLIAQANAQAVEFFRAMLRHPEHGQAGRDYVARRGISEAMQQAFRIGVAPDRWDGLATTIAHKHWDLRAFEMAGLVSPRKQGEGHYDRLRHRLIFPICDQLGRPIAFGGRKLRDEDEPKYLNSPEHKLFRKSATLYGLHLAKKAIIASKTAVLVEGYTDVIACHQHGVENVVAALGTALTGEHVRELRRYCDRAVLVLDGDEAGQKAADRAVEVFITGDLDVAMAVLPGGQDPDELLKQDGGVEQWQQVIAGARDALAFQFARVAEQLEAAPTVTGRQRAIEAYLDRLVSLGLADAGSLRRNLVIQRLAELLHMSEKQVSDLLASRPRRRIQPAHPADSAVPAEQPEADAATSLADAPGAARVTAVAAAERQVIGALLNDNALFTAALPDGLQVDEALPPEEFASAAHRDLYARMYRRLSEGEPVTIASLSADLAFEQLESLAELATQADTETEQQVKTEKDPTAKLKELFTAAVERLRRQADARRYEQEKTHLLPELAGKALAPEAMARFERLKESLTRNSHAVRIQRNA